MLHRIQRAAAVLSSIEFILVCLGLSMLLVLFGTLAQVDLGTFAAQKAYFNSFWVYWRAPAGFRLPVFPGGLTVGALWSASLVAMMSARFRYSWANAGLAVSHVGLILLLFGQLLTQTLARESEMPVRVGQTLDYTESPREVELAAVEEGGRVVSVPGARVAEGGRIDTPLLPFALDVKRFYPNAQLGMASGGPAAATRGVGAQVSISELPPSSSDEEPNSVSAVVEAIDGPRSLGTWLLSTALGAPQVVHAGGKDYTLYLRPRRYYLPFSITLKEFRHDIYPGTDIPKNFSSLVRLHHASKGEDRDVLIYMNHPLRYEGRTFYQASFGQNDTLSVLQVVENPAWLTPYLSCALVLLGLGFHFVASLLKHSRRWA